MWAPYPSQQILNAKAGWSLSKFEKFENKRLTKLSHSLHKVYIPGITVGAVNTKLKVESSSSNLTQKRIQHYAGESRPLMVAGSLLIPVSNSSFHFRMKSRGISTEVLLFPDLLMAKLWRVRSVDWRCVTSLSDKIVGSNKKSEGSEVRKVFIER